MRTLPTRSLLVLGMLVPVAACSDLTTSPTVQLPRMAVVAR
jgi:hypothetical protein